MAEEIDLSEICRVLTKADSKNCLQHLNRMLLGKDCNDYKGILFPGSHPITLLRKHFKNLLEKDYYVCEKSDGVRVMLYIYRNNNKANNFLIDRKEDVYSLDFALPGSRNYLFDGELYSEHKEGKKYLVYAIFDTLIYNDENVMRYNLLKRLNFAHDYVKKLKGVNRFYIGVKKMYKSYGFCQVYNEIPKLNHNNDGMIFTPVDDQYMIGRGSEIYKWKPSHLNTVDLIMRKKKDMNFVYELLCVNKKRQLTVFDHYFDFESEVPDRYDDLIGEFQYSKDAISYDISDFSIITGGWILYKIRTDKQSPNSYRVVSNVLYSIKEQILYDELSNYYDRIRDNWKNRETNKSEKGSKNSFNR